ncbi:E3 ubiquitin-protein ligase TRIM45-like [Ptychodera flava]|uniref:E3 ubiquitin-protein ligase TRIM45-like n=1 Tax=Ptychodera flava TaxID=63121 RepID=UPI00396A0214
MDPEPLYAEIDDVGYKHTYMRLNTAEQKRLRERPSADRLPKAAAVCSSCNRSFKNAKLLPCSHIICLDCADVMISHGVLTCPTCNREHKMPADGAVSLPDCSFLDVLMDGALDSGSAPGKTPVAKGQMGKTWDVLCCVCTKKNSSKFCSDCGIVMCAQCSKTHKNIPATKNHRLMTIDEYKEGALLQAGVFRPNECPKHKGREMSSYCATCDVPICELCVSFQHRKPNHKHKSLKETMGKKQGLLLRKLEDARKKACSLEGLSSELERRDKASAEWYKKKEEEIKVGFKQLMDGLTNAMKFVEAEQEELLRDLHTTRGAEKTMLNGLKEKTDKSLDEMKTCLGAGANLLQHSNEVGFLSLVGDTMATIDKNIDTELGQVPSLTPKAGPSPEDKLGAITDEALSIVVTGNDRLKYVELKKKSKGTLKGTLKSLRK